MKRIVSVALALLLLAGCAGTPQSRETGGTAVVSVLGVEPGEAGLRLLAAAEGRGEREAFRCDSQGATPAAAVEALVDRGSQVVSCAHVEHLLLAQTAAGALPELLSYAFQEPQQSTESQLWLVRSDSLEEVFFGETDAAQRMEVIKSQGKNRQGFCPVTLREAASALARGEALLIPFLEPGDQGLAFGGLALYQEGKVTRWLTGQEALGAALLQGERIHWTGSAGEGAMILQSAGCRVTPQFSQGRLAGLTLHCRLEGVPTGGWTEESQKGDQLAKETAQAMSAALRTLQEAGADAAGLLGRAGLSDPLHWPALSQQWQGAFPLLPAQLAVTVTVTQRQ